VPGVLSVLMYPVAVLSQHWATVVLEMSGL
jgi:hypothetical protein